MIDQSEELTQYLAEQELRRWQEQEFLRFYEPQEQQLAFHNSTAHRRLSHGGVRGAKTLTNIVDIIWRCLGNDFGTSWATWHPEWLSQIETPQWWRMSGPGMQETVAKVIVHWLRTLTPRFTLEGGRFNYSERDHTLRFANGSSMEMMSYDQEEGRGAGRPLHGGYMTESHKCPTYFRKQLLNRLVDKHGHAFADCCPEDGITWENDWYQKAVEGDPDYAAIRFPTVDNAWLYPDHDKTKVSPAIEQIKKDYDYDERMLRVVLYGDFVAIGGLVYEMLNAPMHKMTAAEVGVDPDWPTFVAVDPGIQKAHALIWAKLGPGRQFHVYREATVGRTSVTQTMQELAWAIREKSRDEKIAGVCFDPHWKYNNKTAVTETGEPLNLENALRKALEAVGYKPEILMPARKDPDSWLGIDEVKLALRINPSVDRPLLTFDPHNVEETWAQMRGYSCIPQKKTQQDAHKPRLRRVDDDFCDCVRYLLTTRGATYDVVTEPPVMLHNHRDPWLEYR